MEKCQGLHTIHMQTIQTAHSVQDWNVSNQNQDQMDRRRIDVEISSERRIV